MTFYAFSQNSRDPEGEDNKKQQVLKASRRVAPVAMIAIFITELLATLISGLLTKKTNHSCESA